MLDLSLAAFNEALAQIPHPFVSAAEMDRACTESKLPEQPSVKPELDRLVIRVRREGAGV